MQQTLFNVDDYGIYKAQTPRSTYQKFKIDNNYRKSTDSDRCEYCSNCYKEYNYYKCTLLGFSHSAATDIRLSYVCNQFHDMRNYNLTKRNEFLLQKEVNNE